MIEVGHITKEFFYSLIESRKIIEWEIRENGFFLIEKVGRKKQAFVGYIQDFDYNEIMDNVPQKEGYYIYKRVDGIKKEIK